MYHLKRWKDRVEEFSGDTEIKNLTEEVGIIRMMLEETLNQCNDEDALIQHSGRIIQMVDKVQALVGTIDKMDARAALPPEVLSKIATEWILIICQYVKEEDKLEELSDKLVGCLDKQATLLQISSPGR